MKLPNSPFYLIFAISLLFFGAFDSVNAQKEWAGTYEFGEYTVRIEDKCNQRFYDMVDVVRDPENAGGWLVLCAPHKDGQETIGFLDFEELIREKEGETELETVEVSEDDASTEETSGGFTIWIQDLSSGFSSFISGEILCKEEDGKQPKKGSIVSLEGSVLIQRGLKTITATTGGDLYGGDVLVVRDDALAVIDLQDTGRLKISKKTRFQIPRAQYTCTRNKVLSGIKNSFGGAWHWLKGKLQGENFEVKTPSGTPGVRG